jgi:succinate dehydrogenase (ubiquinone) membrane anchor subunit
MLAADMDTETIQGNVNDPAIVPETAPTHGSYHWTAERYGSFVLVRML